MWVVRDAAAYTRLRNAVERLEVLVSRDWRGQVLAQFLEEECDAFDVLLDEYYLNEFG